ncbi:hypothetical protein [Clostridium beijerinckii]|uniref:hypothetical protein n=1 Tax=Clostridium beijerinckii TaxID=1520 RepID=UPI001F2DD2DA|nr:hypothetical protein [Clostridium beijerinckii]
MELIELKKKYNAALDRNKNAEEYFKKHKVAECLKYLNLFNEVVIELSLLIVEIEALTGKNMTHYEKINGFKLGGD